MVSLSKSFKQAAGNDAFSVFADVSMNNSPFMNNGQSANVDHSKTLLDSLTGGKQSFHVSTTSITQANTNIHSNVASQAQAAKASAQTVQAQVGFAKGQITQTIQEAQRQVHVAMKETGNGGSAVFMNTSSARSDIASAVTGASSGISQLLDACSEMRGASNKDRSKIVAEITDQLRAKSNPVTPSFKGPGEDQPMQALQDDFDWNGFFDNGNDLDDLMAIDPNDPKQLPEWQKLDDLDKQTENVLSQSLTASEDAKTDITVDPEYYCSQAATNLESINQCNIPELVVDDLTAKSLIPQNNVEPPAHLVQNKPSPLQM